MTTVLGIDLGTTNSAMAVLEGKQVRIVSNSEERRTTPSVVGYLKNGRVLVGQSAKNQAMVNPVGTVSSIKRFMGRCFKEAEDEANRATYKVVAGKNGGVAVDVDGKMHSPEEISSLILRKLKEDAERDLQEEVSKAVLAVPAHFDESQRAATRKAAELAGLEVIKILDEPSASALAYGLNQAGRSSTILVFDLGGGTFDVSILELIVGTFAICSIAGDNHLGGDDWDQRVLDWAADRFYAEHGIDLREDPVAHRRLKEAAEEAKINLSVEYGARINLPFVASVENVPLHMDYPLSRNDFEEMTKDLLERCRKPIEEALSAAEMDVSDIDVTVLVGGSTRMPAVRALIEEMTGKKVELTVNPDEVVALGAALQGAVMENGFQGAWLVDATALPTEMRTYVQGVLQTCGWWKEPY